MSESVKRNLNVFSPSMGQIVLQPSVNDAHDIERAQLVLYPHKITAEMLNVGVEWAVNSQTPIFCHASDVPKFEKEGFGSYRFHRLDGYKEIDFHGGSVEFFPARRLKRGGLWGYALEFAESFGLLKIPSYHLLIHPHGEPSLLYLSTPEIDQTEWELINHSKPAWIVGSEFVSKHEWLIFSTRVKKQVLWAGELASLSTAREKPKSQAVAAETTNNAWDAKTGSL